MKAFIGISPPSEPRILNRERSSTRRKPRLDRYLFKQLARSCANWQG
jgi:hypothetical protein